MRSEKEMLELIVNTAREDDRIRAVILNGSRANPNAYRDMFQDFDVVYIVTDVTPFKYNYDWIKRFGELMILQMPEDMDDPPPSDHGGFVYLMQFADGNRIDLGIDPISMLDELKEDSFSILLLDKDGIVGPLEPPSEKSYLPTPPTAKQFADCCNEFWWTSPVVAKGLWRKEIVHAKTIFDHYLREELMKMLVWHIGIKTDFRINPGKFGKYLERYLEPTLWEMLLKTYSGAGYDATWDALETAGNLFRIAALHVAKQFGFKYPHGDDDRVSAHVQHVRTLPRDAKAIY